MEDSTLVELPCGMAVRMISKRQKYERIALNTWHLYTYVGLQLAPNDNNTLYNTKITKLKQNTHTHYLYQMWKRQHVVTSVVGQKYVSHLAHVHLLPMRTCINWKRLHSQRHQTFHIGCCCPHSERLYMVVLHISMHHTRTEYLLNISNLTWIESHNSSTGA